MFNKIKCFYCNQWTRRPQTAKKQRLREFKCQHCTAVNFLDEKGRITDPPVEDAYTTTPQPTRYAHARESNLNRPSPSKVFCNTCLKNQHMLYENLRELDAVSKDEDERKWHEQQLYIQDLEQRYPQVCAQCRPNARSAIKRANYFTRTWNMMISMRKTKSGEYAPVIQGRWWRSALLRFGQIGRDTSVFGQAAWHLLGARMLVENDTEPALGVEQPANVESLAAKCATCVTQAVGGQAVNPHCFVDATPWIFWILVLGAITIWWNNQLRSKYLDRKPGHMTGTRDYYFVQLMSLMARGVAWYFLQSPHRLASSSGIEQFSDVNKIYRNAHIFMMTFIGFAELITRRVIQLDNKFRVRQMRDEDILPDTPAPARTTNNANVASARDPMTTTGQPPAWLRRQPKAFDISSLSTSLDTPSARSNQGLASFQQPQYNPPAAPPTPPLDESMEWSPTGPNFATASFESKSSGHNLRPRTVPQNAQQTRPSPFTQAVPKAPAPRMTHPRAPGQAVRQSSFLSQPALRNKAWWEDEPKEEPVQQSVENESAWNKKRTDFNMSQPSFFLERDRVDTGLEGIFNDVFTLHDDKQSQQEEQQYQHEMRRQASEDGSPGRGHGAMFGSQYEEPPDPAANAAASSRPDSGVWIIMALPVLIMGIALAVVKGWVDPAALLRRTMIDQMAQ